MTDSAITQGHVLEILPTLLADSVDCVVTSPPYWGLRDYKIEPQVWDAVEGCEHEWSSEIWKGKSGGKNSISAGGVLRPSGMSQPEQGQVETNTCLRCGAWRGSLGLEPTPELFVNHIVQVFRAVRRVLKPTGVCFVNLGDSYSGSGEGGGGNRKGNEHGQHDEMVGKRSRGTGLKPKDLCGIPWRVAFALQADGWWLRSDIIWSKPNPMPESVTDRPTKSHEYIFLLTKSAKYFWNQEAVRESYQPNSEARVLRGRSNTHKWSDGGPGNQTIAKDLTAACSHPSGRNIRSVWTFATEPTPEAHFATFPQELVKRCILAGTSEKGCCPKCGKPWEPVVEPSENYKKLLGRDLLRKNEHDQSEILEKGWSQKKSAPSVSAEYKVTGWRPTCSCGEGKTVPAVVLDPFLGSGTTGIVAENLYRKWIGIELNPEYIKIAEKRLKTKANIDQVNWIKKSNH